MSAASAALGNQRWQRSSSSANQQRRSSSPANVDLGENSNQIRPAEGIPENHLALGAVKKGTELLSEKRMIFLANSTNPLPTDELAAEHLENEIEILVPRKSEMVKQSPSKKKKRTTFQISKVGKGTVGKNENQTLLQHGEKELNYGNLLGTIEATSHEVRKSQNIFLSSAGLESFQYNSNGLGPESPIQFNSCVNQAQSSNSPQNKSPHNCITSQPIPALSFHKPSEHLNSQPTSITHSTQLKNNTTQTTTVATNKPQSKPNPSPKPNKPLISQPKKNSQTQPQQHSLAACEVNCKNALTHHHDTLRNSPQNSDTLATPTEHQATPRNSQRNTRRQASPNPRADLAEIREAAKVIRRASLDGHSDTTQFSKTQNNSEEMSSRRKPRGKAKANKPKPNLLAIKPASRTIAKNVFGNASGSSLTPFQ